MIDFFGCDMFGVKAHGDLHKYPVEVAAGLCGLVDLLTPIQKMRCGVAIHPLGVVCDGLKLQGLRRYFDGGLL